ncbi:hypothetical protein WJX74_002114 [Apatococcus lobatus]|uniref:Uncharacterized protein n=2 Tax=Apatococcus TaxID=904362 RepID=A0AAW1RUA3_9CHLO
MRLSVHVKHQYDEGSELDPKRTYAYPVLRCWPSLLVKETESSSLVVLRQYILTYLHEISLSFWCIHSWIRFAEVLERFRPDIYSGPNQISCRHSQLTAAPNRRDLQGC